MTINGACRLTLWTVVLQMWLSAASPWRCAAGQAEGVPPVAPDHITVSIDVKDVDVRDVLRALAQQANVNLAVTEAVKGKITLRLQDVRLEKALDAVVRTARLACKRDGDLTTVMTLPEAESLLKGGHGSRQAPDADLHAQVRQSQGGLRRVQGSAHTQWHREFGRGGQLVDRFRPPREPR
jgi:hypothetical protein